MLYPEVYGLCVDQDIAGFGATLSRMIITAVWFSILIRTESATELQFRFAARAQALNSLRKLQKMRIIQLNSRLDIRFTAERTKHDIVSYFIGTPPKVAGYFYGNLSRFCTRLKYARGLFFACFRGINSTPSSFKRSITLRLVCGVSTEGILGKICPAS